VVDIMRYPLPSSTLLCGQITPSSLSFFVGSGHAKTCFGDKWDLQKIQKVHITHEQFFNFFTLWFFVITMQIGQESVRVDHTCLQRNIYNV